METFEAKIYRPELIVLANPNELAKLYSLIEKDENFIIKWSEGTIANAEVIVATHIAGKVKNGEMKLKSESNIGGK